MFLYVYTPADQDKMFAGLKATHHPDMSTVHSTSLSRYIFISLLSYREFELDVGVVKKKFQHL